MSMNASEMFSEMVRDVRSHGYARTTDDAESPLKSGTVEARPGRSYELRAPYHNYIDVRPVDKRWAVANVLHFFAGTEEAGMLAQYNQLASKFVDPDGFLRGAYGYLALEQMKECLAHLREHRNSRRAFVSLGGFDSSAMDINRPPCWNSLHFLLGRDGLNLVVYQRSANLFGVVPYDCVLLTNVLVYAARAAELQPGCLYWLFGSLHAKEDDLQTKWTLEDRLKGMVLPFELLNSASMCRRVLESNLEGLTV